MPVLKEWLFDYQKACVEWACRRGKAALFLDTGLGKTNCEVGLCSGRRGAYQAARIDPGPPCASASRFSRKQPGSALTFTAHDLPMMLAVAAST